MSFLQELQSKSPSTKANVAFAFACIVTGIIVVVWISTIPARFSGMKGNTEEEKNEVANDEIQNGAEFLDTAKSQLGTVVNWNKPETDSVAESLPADLAPNLTNLNREVGDTVYAEEPTVVVPVVQEEVSQPELRLEDNPGIIMPKNVAPQELPESVPTVPVAETNQKKALIEITTTPPKSIIIETKTDPQEVPQN